MSARIDGPYAAQAAPGLGTGLSESLRGQAGRLQGERVQVLPSAPSPLGDAAEEISLLFAEKAEKRRAEDRLVKAGGRPDLSTYEEISAYFDKAHKEGSPGALADMARRILQGKAEDLYALARSHPQFRQPTEQYLLFQFTRQQAQAEGLGDEVLQRLDAAMADLQAHFGDLIQANLLTIGPAADFAQTPQEVQQFQGSLREVLGSPTMQKALEQVLAMAGQSGHRLDSAIDHLMQALGACLGTGLATQEALLEAVVTDLFHLKSMKTVLDSCRDLVRKLRREKREGRGAEQEEASESEDSRVDTRSRPGVRAAHSGRQGADQR